MIVNTDRGAVRGEREGSGPAVFRGIPYAAPPEGPLRFRAPQPAARWDGVRDALAFSPVAPQPPYPGWKVPRAWSPGDGSDYLTVNVWTPEPPVAARAGLPVMVWIHGGAYRRGSSRLPLYDGTRLAREGVVVVSLNYRLGYEGFGWVDDAPANRGILDQIAALRWVQDNIAGFGGNPRDVTVFAESAGAGCLATLLVAPPARDLFRRAVVQSMPEFYPGEEQARRIAALTTAELGVPPTADALAAVPPERFHRAESAPVVSMLTDPGSWEIPTLVPYGPVRDGVLLDAVPWRALATGAARDVEVIFGFNRDEFTLFATDTLLGADPAQTAAFARLPSGAPAAYRAAEPKLTDAEVNLRIMSDLVFRAPAQWSAEAHATTGGRTFLYELTWDRTPLGAAHAVDLPLVFGNTDDPSARMLLGDTPDPGFEPLSARMRTAWTTFATTGDPGWPPYGPDTRLTRVWDTPPTVTPDPEAAARIIWEGHPYR